MTGTADTQIPALDRPRRRSRRKRWLIRLAAIVILLTICYVGYRGVLRRSVHTELQAIRDAGYPTTLAELGARYPMPDGLNACDVIVSAGAKIDTTDPKYEVLPFVGDGTLPDPAYPIAPGTLTLIEALVNANSEALAELHRAATIEQSRMPIRYSDGVRGLVVGAHEVRLAVQLLTLEAILHAEHDDAERSVQSTLAAFRVSRSLQDEPILALQAFRFGHDWTAFKAVERALQRTPLTDAQLAALDEALRLAESRDALVRSMIGERAVAMDAFGRMAASPSKTVRSWTEDDPYVSRSRFYRRMVIHTVSGMLDLDALSSLEYFERAIDAASLPPHEQTARFGAAKSWVMERPEWRALLTHVILPGISRVAELFTRHVAGMRAARVAVAVERYRLAHGILPGSIDDLTPRFIDAVPLDPYDGEPMRYAVTPTGYAVYSVFENVTDDGGVFTDAYGSRYGPGTDIGVFIRTAALPQHGHEEPVHESPTNDDGGFRTLRRSAPFRTPVVR